MSGRLGGGRVRARASTQVDRIHWDVSTRLGHGAQILGQPLFLMFCENVFRRG